MCRVQTPLCWSNPARLKQDARKRCRGNNLAVATEQHSTRPSKEQTLLVAQNRATLWSTVCLLSRASHFVLLVFTSSGSKFPSAHPAIQEVLSASESFPISKSSPGVPSASPLVNPCRDVYGEHILRNIVRMKIRVYGRRARDRSNRSIACWELQYLLYQKYLAWVG